MRSDLLFVYAFVVLFSATQVNGVGQVILDRIIPIGDSKVSFEDPLFTNHGIIDAVDTQTFDVTRQFELNVGVEDAFLTGLDGGAIFSGSLGASVTSEKGDITFGAATFIDIFGNEVNAIAKNDIYMESQAGDILMSSRLASNIVAGGVSIDGENSLSFFSVGGMSFSAGDSFDISGGGSVSLSADFVAFEARTGDISIAAGNELVYAASDFLFMDGTHGVSLSTAGELNLLSASNAIVRANTADMLVKNEASISYTNIELLADDGVVVGGRTVDLSSSNRLTVEGAFPGSDITVDYGPSFSINAANDITFRTTGETADISVSADDLTVNTARFTVNARTDVEVGSNSTNSLSMNSSTFTLESSYLSMASGNSIYVDSTTSTFFDGNDLYVRGSRTSLEATGSLNQFSARDFRLLHQSGYSQSEGYVTFETTGDMNTQSNSLDLSAMSLNGDFTGTQNYNVEDLLWTSPANEDIALGAVSGLSVSVEDDIDIIASQSIISSEGTLSITATEFDLSSNAAVEILYQDISLTSNLDEISFASANNLFVQSVSASWEAGDETIFDGEGTATMDGNSFTFRGAEDIELTMSKTIFFDVNEDATIVTGEFDYFPAGNAYFKTSDFSMIGTQAFELDGSNFRGRFASLTQNAATTVSYEALDNDIDIYTVGGGFFTSNGDIDFVAGDDLDIFAQEEVRLEAFGNLFMTAIDHIEFTAAEEMLFSSVDDMTIDVFQDSTVSADIVEYYSNTMITSSTFNDMTLLGGGVFVDSGNDILFDGGSMDIATIGGDTREIIFNSHVFQSTTSEDFTVSTDSGTFSSAMLDINSQNNDFLIDTVVSLLETRSYASTASVTSTILGDSTVSFMTGIDDYLNVESMGLMTFTAGTDYLIDAETSLGFDAETFITINSQNTLSYSSIEKTMISSGSTFAAQATNSVSYSAAEDLSFTTQSNNILLTSAVDSITVTLGRDMQMLSNAVDPALGSCAIEFETSNGNLALFETLLGRFTADSYKDLSITSTVEFSAQAGGNLFMDSYFSGLSYFAEGTTAGIELRTQDDNSGNIEFISTDAEIRMFAFEGFLLDASEDMRLSSRFEMNITAEETLGNSGITTMVFDSDADAYFSGARGVAFIAGLDAPEVDGDFSLTADDIYVESQDRLFAQSIGTFSVITEDATSFRTYEGKTIDVSAAAQYLVEADRDVTFTTFDGDQTFTANNDDLIASIASDISIESRNGPVSMEALAGAFTLSGSDWELTSTMDNRALALGEITINAGNNLLMNSLSDNDCILLQNRRASDDIRFSGEVISADSNSDPLDYEPSNILINGDNVDFIVENQALFTSSNEIQMGEFSTPEIRMTAGGDDTQFGVSLNSARDVNIASSSTIGISNSETSITSENSNINSFGFIGMTAVQEDVTITSTTGQVSLAAGIITNIFGQEIGNLHSITADSLTFSQSEYEIDARLRVTSSGTVDLFSQTASFTASDLYDLNVQGTTQITADSILYENRVADDTNSPNPFFSDIQNERGTMTFNMDDLFLVTIIGDTQITVGREQPETIPLNTKAEIIHHFESDFDIETLDFTMNVENGFLDMNVGDTLEFESGGFLNFIALNDISFSASNGNFDVISDFVTLGSGRSLFFTALEDISWEVFGDFSVISQNPTSTHPDARFTSLNGEINFSSTDSIDFLGGINQLQNVDEEYEMRFTSDSDILFSSLTFQSFVELESIFTGGFVDIDHAALSFSSTDLLFQTTSFESDILWNTPSILLTGAGDTTLQGYHGVLLDVTTQTYLANSLNVLSSFGDIISTSSLSTYTAQDILFSAEGHQPDNERAFTILGETITLTSQGAELNLFANREHSFSAGDQSITALDYSFQSSGIDSDTVIASRDSLLFDSANFLLIAAGRSLLMSTGDELTIDVATGATFTSEIRESGILFDTDSTRNAESSIDFFAGSSLSFTAQELNFETDYSQAEDAFISLSSLSDFTIDANSGNMFFTAEYGSISVVASTSAFDVDNFKITGNSLDFVTSSLNLVSVPDFFIFADGDIRFDETSISNFEADDDFDIVTNGYGPSNDITFSAASVLDITVSDDIVFFANGGNTDIVFNFDFSGTGNIGFVSDDDIIIESESGISITGTRLITPESPLSIVADEGDVTLRVEDERGIIFFQSDHDTELIANRIRHLNYEARLGFFSEVPDWIHYVNMQALEGCLRPPRGRCSFRSPPNSFGVTDEIRALNTAAVAIQECIRAFGLVNWRNNLV